MLLLSLLAMGFLVAVLIGIADTKLYPLAIGVVVVALVYNVINHPEIASTWHNLITSAGSNLK
ncbi:MAG: hypothetical protein C5B59_13705 [Bacteroidetes bacterium]|nr:MAG: hypothetical protein C5B59_13705 [Bacteroidota bacterium]